MTIQVVSNDNFYGHQGNDLFDLDRVNYRTFKVKKSCSISEFLDIIAENMVCISVHKLKIYFDNRDVVGFPKLLKLSYQNSNLFPQICRSTLCNR